MPRSEAAKAAPCAGASTGRSWTYRELDALSDTVAAGLAALGAGAGNRIGFLDKNAPEYHPWLYGEALGAVTVAVNWRLAPAEIQYILDNADVRVILVGGEYVDVLSEIDLPSLEKVVMLGEGGSGEHPSPSSSGSPRSTARPPRCPWRRTRPATSSTPRARPDCRRASS